LQVGYQFEFVPGYGHWHLLMYGKSTQRTRWDIGWQSLELGTSAKKKLAFVDYTNVFHSLTFLQLKSFRITDTQNGW